MRLMLCLVSIVVVATPVVVTAQGPAREPPASNVVKATYLIRGLHCEACAPTLEASLKKVEGVRSIKVDFEAKNATIEFDEAVVSAQGVARAIAATPHMMGEDMRYSGALVLNVEGLKDDTTAKRAKDALGKVEGVAKATAFPQQESVSVDFSGSGDATSKQLIEALDKARLRGSHYGHGGMTEMRMNGTRHHRMMCGCRMCMEMMGMSDDHEMDDMEGHGAPVPRRSYVRRGGGCGGCW